MSKIKKQRWGKIYFEISNAKNVVGSSSVCTCLSKNIWDISLQFYRIFNCKKISMLDTFANSVIRFRPFACTFSIGTIAFLRTIAMYPANIFNRCFHIPIILSEISKNPTFAMFFAELPDSLLPVGDIVLMIRPFIGETKTPQEPFHARSTKKWSFCEFFVVRVQN